MRLSAYFLGSVAACALLVGHTAIAQETETASASQSTSAGTGEVYEPDYFDRFSPKTARDMLDQIPGFSLRRGNGDRGLGQGGTNVIINVQEIKNPSLSSRVVASQIAGEIERRLPFRRSMKMAMERVMKSGAKGVKISVAGRLNDFNGIHSSCQHPARDAGACDGSAGPYRDYWLPHHI